MNLPIDNLITIITVNLNNRAGLEKTICSVISQQNARFEYIIVDGGSNDGSVEIIKEYGHNLAGWISEADHGPYDAMNKGIEKATGEWIIFLNAGDTFHDNDCLSMISMHLQKNGVDALYGDSIADYGDFKTYRTAAPFSAIWKGMVFSHQALVMKTALIKDSGFDTRFPKIADYDLVLRCLPDPGSVKYIAQPLAICDAKGISTSGQAGVLKDYYKRSGQSFPLSFGRKLYFMRSYFFLLIIDLTKKILSEKYYYRMIRLIGKTHNPE